MLKGLGRRVALVEIRRSEAEDEIAKPRVGLHKIDEERAGVRVRTGGMLSELDSYQQALAESEIEAYSEFRPIVRGNECRWAIVVGEATVGQLFGDVQLGDVVLADMEFNNYTANTDVTEYRGLARHDIGSAGGMTNRRLFASSDGERVALAYADAPLVLVGADKIHGVLA